MTGSAIAWASRSADRLRSKQEAALRQLRADVRTLAHVQSPSGTRLDGPYPLRRFDRYPKAPARDADAKANKFASAMFRPNPSGRVNVAHIRTAYQQWCRERGLEPLLDREIGAALGSSHCP